jgi:hypothetical protein
MSGAGWNTLEIVKLGVSMLTPFAVGVVGYFVHRATTRLESVQWANQIVIQRRLDVFREVAPKLNRLLCFAVFVGRWKEVTPADAVQLKREADEIMYVNRVLFSPELFDAYQTFIRTLFELYGRTDGNAPLRVVIECPLGNRRNLDWWHDEMEQEFATTGVPSFDEVFQTYEALSERFRRDLYVTREELALPAN